MLVVSIGYCVVMGRLQGGARGRLYRASGVSQNSGKDSYTSSILLFI